MCKNFFIYLWLVLKRAISGVFIIVDLLGVLLLVLSFNQPKIPFVISLGVFIIIWVISSFSVWQGSELDKKKLRLKITNIRDKIPKYSVDFGVIEKFSINKLVSGVTDELTVVRNQLKQQQDAKNLPSSSLFGGFSQFTINLPSFLRNETLEEKESRLGEYLEKLIAYNTELMTTYKVPFFFEVSRADSNVEFEVEVSPESVLIVHDNYTQSELPVTFTPLPYGPVVPFIGAAHIPSGGLANRLYPYSYAKNSIGYSKLNKVNASQKYNIFDEDFYIKTDSDDVELKVTIHSEKINEPQITTIKLDLRNIISVEIEHTTEDD